MNIIKRGKEFFQALQELANRSLWDWMRCPNCGSMDTIKHGTYTRNPWFLDGREEVKVQRHKCNACGPTYSETLPLLKRRSWYAREVHRSAIDHWQHLGTSLRRTAEVLRSWMGKQERYLFWLPLAEGPSESKRCHLSASTVHRWLDKAGIKAQESVEGLSLTYYQGLQRVTPEWCWRDFRLRLSHGRNHGSEQRQKDTILPCAELCLLTTPSLSPSLKA